jgi:hypothetical protein
MYFLKRRRFEGEVSLWIVFYGGFMKTIERLFFIEAYGKPIFFPILSFLSLLLVIYHRIRKRKPSSFK